MSNLTFQITGEVLNISDEYAPSANFKKVEVAVRVQDGDYTQDLVVEFQNKNLDTFYNQRINVGEQVCIDFNLTGRSYEPKNGGATRYQNTLRGFRVSHFSQG